MKYFDLVFAVVVMGVASMSATVGASEPADEQVEKSVTPEVVATDHHVTYMFMVKPGATHSFPLPAVGTPIRLMAAQSAQNGGTETPSAVISAVISQDSMSGQLTWISTYSDGSQHAGNTINGGPVAEFAGDTAALTAVLPTGTAPMAHLEVTLFSGTTIIPIKYYVTMDY